jgi:hypothetical protein
MTDKAFIDGLRREFGYRCGFCGVAETMLPWPAWPRLLGTPHHSSSSSGKPVYACERCIYDAAYAIKRTRTLEHRAEKSYFRHLRFEPDGRIASLTPHGENQIIALRLNDPAKVKLRWRELKIREESCRLLKEVPGLLVLLSEAMSSDPARAIELIKIKKHLNTLIRDIEIDFKRLPEPIDNNFSRKELVEFDHIEAEKHLTPYLLSHLKNKPEDLLRIQPEVFESLVAEFFASEGYEVHLAGRNSRTGADVVALRKHDPFSVEIRYMIEVKRWRKKVGIQEIRKVAGVLALEKHKYGWQLALLVSAAGFKNLQSTNLQGLSMLGIELRGKEDLLKALRSYKPRMDGGLWLNYGWEDALSGVQIR